MAVESPEHSIPSDSSPESKASMSRNACDAPPCKDDPDVGAGDKLGEAEGLQGGDSEDMCVEVAIEGMVSAEERAPKRQRVAEVVCQVCERSWPFSACVNVGTEAYPCYRDKACHNAARALERSAESKGKAAAQALQLYKKNKRKAWRIDVLKFRVCSADDPPLPPSLCEAVGVDSVGSRKDIIRRYMEAWESRWAVQTIRDCTFLTKRQFIAWYKTREGYTQAEAEARWDADEAGGVDRETNEKGEVVLKVALPKVVRSISEQSYAQSLELADTGGETGFSDDMVEQLRDRLRTASCHGDLQKTLDMSFQASRCSMAHGNDTEHRRPRGKRGASSLSDGGASMLEAGSVASDSGSGKVTIMSVVHARQQFLREAKSALAEHCLRKCSVLVQLQEVDHRFCPAGSLNGPVEVRPGGRSTPRLSFGHMFRTFRLAVLTIMLRFCAGKPTTRS